MRTWICTASADSKSLKSGPLHSTMITRPGLHPGRVDARQMWYPHGITNMQHIAPSAMDGHTPPSVFYASDVTPSADSGGFPTGPAPMLPNMMPTYGFQGPASTTTARPDPSNVQVFAHSMHVKQQFPVHDERMYQPQASRPIAHQFFGQVQSRDSVFGGALNSMQNAATGAHHIPENAQLAPSATVVSHATNKRMALNTARSSLPGMPSHNGMTGISQLGNQHQQPMAVYEASQQPQTLLSTAQGASAQQHTTAQAGNSSPGELSSLGRTPSHSSSRSYVLFHKLRKFAIANINSHPLNPKVSSKPISTPKNPNLAQSGNDASGMQPPLKLGPKVAPTEHPPQHDFNSSMRTLKQSDVHQE